MAEIVRPTTCHLKIGHTAPNQLTNSTDNTSYHLTNLPTPVSLLTVDAALKMTVAQKQSVPLSSGHFQRFTRTQAKSYVLITEMLDAYLRLQVTIHVTRL